jgi:hypothetical protein
MKTDVYRKVALLHEVAKQNRMIELRLKMQKCKNELIRKQFEKMLENLSK